MILDLGLYFFWFVLVIGVLVIIHEGGHFLAARALKIGVTNFAIGMGPTLFAWKPKNSECSYEIRALPIGGFVKMVGDMGASSSSSDQSLINSMTDDERKKAFPLRPLWQKAIVVAAGPMANIILGIALFMSLYMVNGQTIVAPIVSEIIENSPAERAGLQPGDRIVRLDGEEVTSFRDITQKVAINLDQTVEMDISRKSGEASEIISLTITPEVVETVNFIGSKEKVGRIGIVAKETEFREMGPLESIQQGFDDVKRSIVVMGTAIKQLLTGQRHISEMGGPVKIAEVSGKAAELGWVPLIMIVAVLSVNLAIMNLLPIPILDGGHLMLYAIEGIKGSPLSEKHVVRLQKGALVFLVTLMLVVTYYDIYSVLERTGIF